MPVITAAAREAVELGVILFIGLSLFIVLYKLLERSRVLGGSPLVRAVVAGCISWMPWFFLIGFTSFVVRFATIFATQVMVVALLLLLTLTLAGLFSPSLKDLLIARLRSPIGLLIMGLLVMGLVGSSALMVGLPEQILLPRGVPSGIVAIIVIVAALGILLFIVIGIRGEW
jgi:hypothetical protein